MLSHFKSNMNKSRICVIGTVNFFILSPCPNKYFHHKSTFSAKTDTVTVVLDQCIVTLDLILLRK
jgi:hypothetical protein